jgi:hypothetical protein
MSTRVGLIAAILGYGVLLCSPPRIEIWRCDQSEPIFDVDSVVRGDDRAVE